MCDSVQLLNYMRVLKPSTVPIKEVHGDQRGYDTATTESPSSLSSISLTRLLPNFNFFRFFELSFPCAYLLRAFLGEWFISWALNFHLAIGPWSRVDFKGRSTILHSATCFTPVYLSVSKVVSGIGIDTCALTLERVWPVLGGKVMGMSPLLNPHCLLILLRKYFLNLQGLLLCGQV